MPPSAQDTKKRRREEGKAVKPRWTADQKREATKREVTKREAAAAPKPAGAAAKEEAASGSHPKGRTQLPEECACDYCTVVGDSWVTQSPSLPAHSRETTAIQLNLHFES